MTCFVKSKAASTAHVCEVDEYKSAFRHALPLGGVVSLLSRRQVRDDFGPMLRLLPDDHALVFNRRE